MMRRFLAVFVVILVVAVTGVAYADLQADFSNSYSEVLDSQTLRIRYISNVVKNGVALPGEFWADIVWDPQNLMFMPNWNVGQEVLAATGVTGSWNVTVVDSKGGGGTFTMNLIQSGSSVSGTTLVKGYNGTVIGSISGENIALIMPDPDPACSGSAGTNTGTVNGNTMSGSYTSTAGGTCPVESGTWTATR